MSFCIESTQIETTGRPRQARGQARGQARAGQEGKEPTTHALLPLGPVVTTPHLLTKITPTPPTHTNKIQAAAPGKKAAPKPAVRKDDNFAGGLIGSDVEALAFDPWKLSADRDAEGLAWYRAAELKHGAI